MQDTTEPFNLAAFTERFNLLYARHSDSPTHSAIFREVYGADYAEEAVPLSHVTLSLLRRMAQALVVEPAAQLIDLGCGRAGPGLWVARATGASLVGVDLANVAVAQAAQHAAAFGLTGRVCFEIGDLTALRFADQVFDAAMSVDVLWMVPDRLAALREAARILRPGARFAFTTWDKDLAPPGTPAPLGDHRPLLRQAGFDIEVYEHLPQAESQRRAIYERFLAREQALRAEMGDAAAAALLLEARRNLGLLDGVDYLRHSRRIFVVGRRH